MKLWNAWKHRRPTAERIARNHDPLVEAQLEQVELLHSHGIIGDDQLERSQQEVLDDATRDGTTAYGSWLPRYRGWFRR